MQCAARVRWAFLWIGGAASCVACSSNPPHSSLANGSSGAMTANAGAEAGGSQASGGATAGSNAGGNSASGANGNSAGAATGGAGSGSGGGAGSAGSAAAGLDCTGRTVCDDFEKGAVVGNAPGAPWKLHQNKGTVTLDDQRAFSGKYSVKVSVSATAADDTYRQALLNLDGSPLIPLPGNKVYGRFMIYTDRIPDKSVHWTFAHGDGPYANSGTTATYNYGGMGGLMANYYRNTMPDPTDCWQTKDQSFTTGKWQCVGFLFDGANNEMRFWLGPNEVDEVHVLGNQKSDATCTVKGVDGKWYAPEFKNISVGWESYQHDVAGAHDAWIDDVVLDDDPIACP